MSTVTNIELVPRESHKDAARGNHRSKRSIEGSAALQLGQQASLRVKKMPQPPNHVINNSVQMYRVPMSFQGQHAASQCNIRKQSPQMRPTSGQKPLSQTRRFQWPSLPIIEPARPRCGKESTSSNRGASYKSLTRLPHGNHKPAQMPILRALTSQAMSNSVATLG